MSLEKDNGYKTAAYVLFLKTDMYFTFRFVCTYSIKTENE